MNEQLSWVQWWAYPWRSAHTDWDVVDKYCALDALCRSKHALMGTALGIQSCLPATPQITVLRLALASTAQLELMLALLGDTCHRSIDGSLSETQHLWCLRLSKALSMDTLLSDNDDPLQLLRAWVEPTVWQRLRLRFARHRVLALEQNTHTFEDPHSRLDTLWQAVVWRITTTTNEEYLL
ncbi:type III secretion protein [Pseudomonas yamanorum]|jgi:hypothetical protein|uniref:type III secretion protein n=1 Tax=Pseudomonas yamanorum TaxID=515393 RepID=UPI0015A060E3|nr:type III secretion protein [Pseudomonas yamanorum]NWD25898.1 type III secretion protein [Pseudomonas yamanorum]